MQESVCLDDAAERHGILVRVDWSALFPREPSYVIADAIAEISSHKKLPRRTYVILGGSKWAVSDPLLEAGHCTPCLLVPVCTARKLAALVRATGAGQSTP